MPVGLLRRPVHSDPLIPQRGVGERERQTKTEREGFRFLISWNMAGLVLKSTCARGKHANTHIYKIYPLLQPAVHDTQATAATMDALLSGEKKLQCV